jgi:hypothetical protein
MPVSQITRLSAPEEQHMLFLFLPLKSAAPSPKPKTAPKSKTASTTPQSKTISTLHALFSGKLPNGKSVLPDPRIATGVHFFMIYMLKAGETPPPSPFPTFQLPPPNPETKAPRDLAVVISIYDADFGPYIEAFTNNKPFASVLDNTILKALDETGLVNPDDPTSAINILANKGTNANPDAFIALLMRYNWADPTIPAATSFSNIKRPNPNWKHYFLGATFPGLTIGKILKPVGGYPNASQLWPFPGPVIDFAPSTSPV